MNTTLKSAADIGNQEQTLAVMRQELDSLKAKAKKSKAYRRETVKKAIHFLGTPCHRNICYESREVGAQRYAHPMLVITSHALHD